MSFYVVTERCRCRWAYLRNLDQHMRGIIHPDPRCPHHTVDSVIRRSKSPKDTP